MPCASSAWHIIRSQDTVAVRLTSAATQAAARSRITATERALVRLPLGTLTVEACKVVRKTSDPAERRAVARITHWVILRCRPPLAFGRAGSAGRVSSFAGLACALTRWDPILFRWAGTTSRLAGTSCRPTCTSSRPNCRYGGSCARVGIAWPTGAADPGCATMSGCTRSSSVTPLTDAGIAASGTVGASSGGMPSEEAGSTCRTICAPGSPSLLIPVGRGRDGGRSARAACCWSGCSARTVRSCGEASALMSSSTPSIRCTTDSGNCAAGGPVVGFFVSRGTRRGRDGT